MLSHTRYFSSHLWWGKPQRGTTSFLSLSALSLLFYFPTLQYIIILPFIGLIQITTQSNSNHVTPKSRYVAYLQASKPIVENTCFSFLIKLTFQYPPLSLIPLVNTSISRHHISSPVASRLLEPSGQAPRLVSLSSW